MITVQICCLKKRNINARYYVKFDQESTSKLIKLEVEISQQTNPVKLIIHLSYLYLAFVKDCTQFTLIVLFFALKGGITQLSESCSYLADINVGLVLSLLTK